MGTINIIIFIIILLLSSLNVFLSSLNLPQIILPKGAQHNTLGELPIVEVMDDGDFYEKDGEESISCKQSCQAALESQCEWIHKKNHGKIEKIYFNNKKNKFFSKLVKAKTKNYKQCVDMVINLCSVCYPDCEELENNGFFWTCNSLGYR